MHITQGDYEGKAVIISWVTPDEPGPNSVQYGTSDNSYEFTAEGTVTNYTFYQYKSGYIHHCLLSDLKVTECSFMMDAKYSSYQTKHITSSWLKIATCSNFFYVSSLSLSSILTDGNNFSLTISHKFMIFYLNYKLT